MKHLALIPVAVLAVTLVGACSSDPPDRCAGPVKLQLADYSITMPKTIAGPLVDLDITNGGSFADELDLGQVVPGATLEAAAAFFTQGPGEGAPLIADPGGANVIGPGAHFGYARTLTPGTHVVAATNTGTRPHGMNIGGVPSSTDLSRGEEIGAWMEGGQSGPPPLPIDFPGGLKSIAPGVTAVLTFSLNAAHTYMFSDDNNGDGEILALVDVP